MPCRCYIESASRTQSHLARTHQVFSKTNKGASTAARATSSLAAHAQGQLQCGTAAQPWLSLLGKQPCGKPCWECLHSAQELLPCTGPHCRALVLILTLPTACTSSLATSLQALATLGADPSYWHQTCSALWAGVPALSLLPHTAPAASPGESPGAQIPLTPRPKARGSQVTQVT